MKIRIEEDDRWLSLKKKILKTFQEGNEYPWRDIEVEIWVKNDKENTVEITVSRMYSFLPLTFGHVEKLTEVFGTKDFNINNWSSSGCETCDFGSQYSHVFTIKNFDIDKCYER